MRPDDRGPALTPLVLLTACNQAPLDYRVLGKAPGHKGNWMFPAPFCENSRFESPDDPVIDGLRLCLGNVTVKAVDDPIFVACGDAELDGQQDVAWLYDGVVARAYALSALLGREIVHDELRGIPIFVNY